MSGNVFIRNLLSHVSPSELIFALEYNGIKVNGRGQFLCPFHDDHSPSASIRRGTSRAKCWSCGASIDAINVTAKMQGCSQKAAAMLLHVQGICDFPELQEELDAKEIRSAARSKKQWKRKNNTKKRVTPFPLTSDEVKLIGLDQFEFEYAVNHGHRFELKVLEEASNLVRYRGCADDEDNCPLLTRGISPSIWVMYREDKEAALFLMRSMTEQAKEYLEDLCMEMPTGDLEEVVTYKRSIRDRIRIIEGITEKIETAAAEAN